MLMINSVLPRGTPGGNVNTTRRSSFTSVDTRIVIMSFPLSGVLYSEYGTMTPGGPKTVYHEKRERTKTRKETGFLDQTIVLLFSRFRAFVLS
jgi:hypothetical protein